MAISQNFPSIRPTLSLNFASSRTLDPRITFSRNSIGTYFDSNSVLRTASANVARIDHNPLTGESLGLLLEEQVTNLALRSEEFNEATSWFTSNASITPNAVVAPSGLQTADKLVEDTAASIGHFVRLSPSPALTAGQSYTYSVFAKAAERTFLQLILTGVGAGGSNIVAGFDLIAGTAGTPIGGTSSISPYGNGWYRCSLSATASTTANAQAQIRLSLNSSSFPSSYTGDGASGIFIWGAQLEVGASPTTYIPTAGATATRSADVASITGANLSSWYRQDEGSFLVSTFAPKGLVIFGTGNTFDDTHYAVVGTSNNIAFRSGGANQAILSSAVSTTAITSLAIGYATNSFAAVSNGGPIATSASGSVSNNHAQLKIGSAAWNMGGGSSINGTIRRLVYWPVRLPNSVLQAITA